MYRVFETIKIQDGIPQNLRLHEDRIRRTCRDLYNAEPSFSLSELKAPEKYRIGTVKCRLRYTPEEFEALFAHYIPRKIAAFKLVESDDIDYSHKYIDRCSFNYLSADLQGADEIIIVKSGLITDCSYANLVFWDGREMYTPNTPLLKGTKRRLLLEEGIIREARISKDDLGEFAGICPINAMLDPETPPKPRRIIY